LISFSLFALGVCIVCIAFLPSTALGQPDGDDLAVVQVIDEVESQESAFDNNLASAKVELKKKLEKIEGDDNLAQSILDTLRRLDYKRAALADSLAQSRSRSIIHAKKAKVFARFNRRVLGQVQGLITPEISRFFEGWKGAGRKEPGGEEPSQEAEMLQALDSLEALAARRKAGLDTIQAGLKGVLGPELELDLLGPLKREVDSVKKQLRRYRRRQRARKRSAQRQHAVERVGTRLVIKTRSTLQLAEQAAYRARKHFQEARRQDRRADSLRTTHEILRRADHSGNYSTTDDDLDDIIDDNRQ
jgi:hypothetical protein